MKKLAFLLLLCVTSCHTAKVAPPPQIRVRQQSIAERDLGWVYDTLPVVRFNPPPAYGAYRIQVEACVGHSKPGWPRFYIAPVPTFGADYLAAYFNNKEAIVFGLGNETNAYVVRHELVHWLLAPVNEHPREFYGDSLSPGRCGHLLRVER